MCMSVSMCVCVHVHGYMCARVSINVRIWVSVCEVFQVHECE